MDCCYSDGGCDSYEVTPMLAPPCCDCCEAEPACYPHLPACDVGCCKKSPKMMYCCEKKPPKVMYCCENKPPKVMYCSEKKSPKVVYCCKKPSCNECCSPCCDRSPSPCRRSTCCPDCEPGCQPVKTKYIIPCYRYEDGRIVRRLPVSAFKRNGMQDQEHSKLLGTANFLVRSPRDVSIECDAYVQHVKVADPAKVPQCSTKPAVHCGFLRKRPVEKNQPTVLMRRACEVACGARQARRAPFVVSSYHADPEHEVRRFHAEDERGNCCYHFERKKPDCCEPAHICDPCVPTGTCVSSPGCEYVSSLIADRGSPLSCCYYCR